MIREEVWSRSVWYALSMALMHALREISSNEDADTKMLSVARFEKVSSKYTKILDEGRTELPECPPRKGKRGRIPKCEAEKLHEAFVKYKNDTLRFAKLSEVPFSNNRAYADNALQGIDFIGAHCAVCRHSYGCLTQSDWLLSRQLSGIGNKINLLLCFISFQRIELCNDEIAEPTKSFLSS